MAEEILADFFIAEGMLESNKSRRDLNLNSQFPIPNSQFLIPNS